MCINIVASLCHYCNTISSNDKPITCNIINILSLTKEIAQSIEERGYCEGVSSSPVIVPETAAPDNEKFLVMGGAHRCCTKVCSHVSCNMVAAFLSVCSPNAQHSLHCHWLGLHVHM